MALDPLVYLPVVSADVAGCTGPRARRRPPDGMSRRPRSGLQNIETQATTWMAAMTRDGRAQPQGAAQRAGHDAGQRHGAVVDDLHRGDLPRHQVLGDVAVAPRSADHVARDHADAHQEHPGDQGDQPGARGAERHQQGRWPGQHLEREQGAGGPEPVRDPRRDGRPDDPAQRAHRHHQPDGPRAQVHLPDEEQDEQRGIAGQAEVAQAAHHHEEAHDPVVPDVVDALPDALAEGRDLGVVSRGAARWREA